MSNKGADFERFDIEDIHQLFLASGDGKVTLNDATEWMVRPQSIVPAQMKR